MTRFASLQDARRIMWHLRHGGIQQLRIHLRRRRLGLLDDLPSTPVSTSDSSQPLSGLAGKTPSNAPAGYALNFLPGRVSLKSPTFADLTVATILDEFSHSAWSHEFTAVPVTPKGWRGQVERSKPSILFVESAWAGNGGTWRYQLTGSKAPSSHLRELITYCRENRIPTVFWNKEDPPHFHDFLETARLFDVVMTSDSRKIDDYRQELGHDRVYSLAFAAQPAMHNPIRPRQGFHSRDIAFAGTYFAHKYPERREQMRLLLGAALKVSSTMPIGLEIFSRFKTESERYQFPEPFHERVVGELPYEEMLTAYQAYRVFLNVNSVVDSPSMCARRIFEITAAGTPVVSPPSAAIPRFFGPGEISVVETADEAANMMKALMRSPELSDRLVHLAQRRIWKEHTYSHRLVQVLEAVGLGRDLHQRSFAQRLDLPETSAIVCTNRPHQLSHVLKTLGEFRDVDLEVILLTHGFEVKLSEVREEAADYGLQNIQILSRPKDISLGDCLNAAVDRASGAVVTKIDDDDHYGPMYLADLLRAMDYSGADIVGKQAHYMYVGEQDATLLRFPDKEHRWTDFVMGPTITGNSDVFREIRFASLSSGEDSDFLRRATVGGAHIYSSDRFNFCQRRLGRAGGHAWEVGDPEILATGEVKFFGVNSQHLNC